MARITKPKGPILKTVEELEACVASIADLTCQKLNIEGAMNTELQAVRDRYSRELVDVADDIQAEVRLAKDWAEHNPEMFRERKSIECVHGAVGFRTGMPAVRYLKGWTEERCLEALQLSAEGAAFLRMAPSINKEAVIAAAADENIGDAGLAEFGMKVTQAESFFVNPKIETKKA